MSTDHLIILAGGRGTRLSPLTGSTSKALVTVGQRPVIIQQIIGVGVQDVTVVVSPSTLGAVRDVLTRGLPKSYRVDYVVQDTASGPDEAIMLATAHLPIDKSAVVLFADTLLSWEAVPHDGTWIGVGEGTHDRSWCYLDAGEWKDGTPTTIRPAVFVGALRVGRISTLRVARSMYDDGADGMASFLQGLTRSSDFEIMTTMIPGWVDTGDLQALANARREAFRTRDTNHIKMTDCGTVIKHGVSREQVRELQRSPLYPHVYHHSSDWVEMDYVSAPSLAELYLYGSPNVAAWKYMLETVIDRCSNYLWVIAPPESDHALERSRQMYQMKLRDRAYGYVPSDDVELLVERLEPIVTSSVKEARQCRIHGDLNFCNILYDVGSDVIRLIDPRGSWGDETGYGDILYEAAKLRYSWRAFAAINHDVYGRSNDPDLVRALDEVLRNALLVPSRLTLEDCAAVEASLFWSALPLHPPRHHDALIAMGYECLKEASAKI